MEFPVRCFTCGALVGHLHEAYREAIKERPAAEILNGFNVERYCCRRMFLSHVDMIPALLKYKKN